MRMKDVRTEALASGMSHAAALFERQVTRRRLEAPEARRRMALLFGIGQMSGIKSMRPELEKAIKAAHNKNIMLDFYADWCISCKEMEVNTFANAEVASELKQMVLLQADVTANSPENQALLKRFGLFGPPGILIFNQNSEEQKDQRVIGYMPPQRFIERLRNVLKN